MISRVLAGLIVAFAASVNVAAAAENVVGTVASSEKTRVAIDTVDEKRLEWDDADPTPDKPKPSSTRRDAAAKADDAKSPAAAREKPTDAATEPGDSRKAAEPAQTARKTTPAEEAAAPRPDTAESSDTLKSSAPAVAAKPEAAAPAGKDAEPAKAGGATDVSGAKSATRASGAVKAPATDRSTKGSSPAAMERQAEPALRARSARRDRDGVSADFATTRTTDRGRAADRGRAVRGPAERVWVSPEDEPVVTRSEAYGGSRGPAMRVAQAPRRPFALGATPIAEEVAARRSTPISGGILCGGGSKWRCNWIEREHDKFYKFTKGHGWTDQTMATDFCATERQMRVASATRIKSIQGGCCGFVVVQVTCKR